MERELETTVYILIDEDCTSGFSRSLSYTDFVLAEREGLKEFQQEGERTQTSNTITLVEGEN